MGNADNSLHNTKRLIASFAIYGLVSALVAPSSKKEFIEAHRAIFDGDSIELKQLSAAIGIDTKKLQKKIFAYLSAEGFSCDSTLKN